MGNHAKAASTAGKGRKADPAATPAATPPRKGKVYAYVKTDRGLVPVAKLHEAAVAKAAQGEGTPQAPSEQLVVTNKFFADKGLVPHPMAVASMLTLMDNCSFFDACVRQIARDVCGMGFSLVGRNPKAKPQQAGLDKLQAFFDDPGTDDSSLADTLERAIIDLESVGWWCLEVVEKGPGNTPNGLYHVPAHTVFVHRDGNKYCQIREGKYRWYKRMGYGSQVNKDTGEEAAELPVDQRASSLLFYRNYYPLSSWYGVPPALSSVGSIKAIIGIRDYNLSFFDNYGVPAAIVTITGDWEEEAIKGLSDFIDVEIKGSNNAHKTVVLNPPEGGEVKWEPLVAEVKEGHFKLYLKNLRDEVLVCFRMPPYRIGIAEVGSLGGSTAPEATHIYVGSTVNPIKLAMETQLTRRVIKGDENGGFGVGDVLFKLGEVDLRDRTAIATRCVSLFGIGAMNANEVRTELGMEALDEKAHPYAVKYFTSTSYAAVGEAQSVEALAEAEQAARDLAAATRPKPDDKQPPAGRPDDEDADDDDEPGSRK